MRKSLPLCNYACFFSGSVYSFFFRWIMDSVCVSLLSLVREKKKRVCVFNWSFQRGDNGQHFSPYPEKKEKKSTRGWQLGGYTNVMIDIALVQATRKQEEKQWWWGKGQTGCSMGLVSSVGVTAPLLLYRPKREKGRLLPRNRPLLRFVSHAQASYNFRKGGGDCCQKTSVCFTPIP